MTHLLEGGLVGHFEDDPAQPVLRRIVTSTRKAMGDNSDAIYYDASVSSRYAYRLRGRTRGRDLRVVHRRGRRRRRRLPRAHRGGAERLAVRRRRRRPLRGVPRRTAARAQLDRARRRRDPRHHPALLGGDVVARGAADREPRARDRGDRRTGPAAAAERCIGRGGLPAGRTLRAVAHARTTQAGRGRAARRSCRANPTCSRRRCRRAITRSRRPTPRTAWRRTYSVPTRRS